MKAVQEQPRPRQYLFNPEGLNSSLSNASLGVANKLPTVRRMVKKQIRA